MGFRLGLKSVEAYAEKLKADQGLGLFQARAK
jgi:hypothetical protein